MTAVARSGILELQMVFKKRDQGIGFHHLMKAPATLGELREGQEAILESIELPADASRRLMELGFLPGSSVAATRSAPSGDPLVFRVDGSEVALRRETAEKIRLRRTWNDGA